MNRQDYYRVLGVERGTSPADVRAAYARLAKKHHPDLSHAGAELPQRLRELQAAYRCLSDAESRAAHDRMLDTLEREHFARQQVLHRRLRRYDRRHPHAVPGRYRNLGRRGWLVLACGAAIVTHVSLRLFG